MEKGKKALTDNEHPRPVRDLVLEAPRDVVAARHHRRHPPAVRRRRERVVPPSDRAAGRSRPVPTGRRQLVLVPVRVRESAADDHLCENARYTGADVLHCPRPAPDAGR